MKLAHRLSSTLRHTGHGYIADELDRLVNVINSVHHEAADNNGYLDKTTHYKLASLIVEQSVETPELAEVPL